MAHPVVEVLFKLQVVVDLVMLHSYEVKYLVELNQVDNPAALN